MLTRMKNRRSNAERAFEDYVKCRQRTVQIATKVIEQNPYSLVRIFVII